MNKWLLIFIILVILGVGAYFVFKKNDTTSVQPTATTNEQQNTEPTISQQQNIQVKTPQTITPKPTNPPTNNTEGIPQPPKLPE